ncbi:MAG TPA: sigma-70 family RNA polymerase sigma factor [Puia sp.]
MPIEAIHNEKDLLRQVAQGDRVAFRALYTTYFPLVQQYVALFEPSKDSLDELTQDVFVRIWDKRVRLEGVDSFKNYLFMVTRNVVFNFLRSLKMSHRVKELEGVPEVSADGDPENELLFRQYYQMAMEAMEKLPPGRRKVLKMSIDDGLSLDEIASELNISRSGVKKQLYAATAFVRQYLQDHGEISLLLFVFLSLFEV